MKSILLTSSILILVLAALRPMLRGRIDPRVQYALWILAALRLLVPVNLASSTLSAAALWQRAELSVQAELDVGNPPVSNSAGPSGSTNFAVTDHSSVPAVTPVQTPSVSLDRIAGWCWLGGAAVMGMWFLAVNLRFRRRLRTSAVPVDMGEMAELPVFVSEELASPCLCGIFQPVIYVTPASLEHPDRLRHILAHEMTHYRHKDPFWAVVRCVCLCVYWFDPLVWWAAELSRRDCELACDEGAIRRLGEQERLSYGCTLVDMISVGRASLFQTSTTMPGSRKRIRERVKLIAKRPRTVALAVVVLTLVVGLTVGCTFTGAPEAEKDDFGAATLDVQDAVEQVMSGASVHLIYVMNEEVSRCEVSPDMGNGRNREQEFEGSFRCSREESPEYIPGDPTLLLAAADDSLILQFWKDSDFISLSRGEQRLWYRAIPEDEGDGMNQGVFEYWRMWFDEAEIESLWSDIVIPDQGQTREEVAQAWADAYEGAMLKVTPGSKYACSYVRNKGVSLADWLGELSEEELDSFYPAYTAGHERFAFSYETVFVPEGDISMALMAGNTEEYTGVDAPEGAYIYGRCGYMYLTDDGWRCDGTGTGW